MHSSGSNAIVGETVAVVILIIVALCIVIMIVIVYLRRISKQASPVYDQETCNITEVNTDVAINHNPSYNITEADSVERTIEDINTTIKDDIQVQTNDDQNYDTNHSSHLSIIANSTTPIDAYECGVNNQPQRDNLITDDQLNTGEPTGKDENGVINQPQDNPITDQLYLANTAESTGKDEYDVI